MPNASMMHGRFHRLLGTLVLFFLVSAFLQGDRAGVRFLGLVFAIVVIVAIVDIGACLLPYGLNVVCLGRTKET